MKVLKFVGAVIDDAEKIKSLTNVIKQYAEEGTAIIISSTDKTTIDLEKIAQAFYAAKKEEALNLFNEIKKQQINTAKKILSGQLKKCLSQLNDFFTEVEWLLHDKPIRSFEYYYDQIVCSGELMISCLLSHYLIEEKINNEWIDARDLIRTDNHFKEANIDELVSSKNILQRIKKDKNKIYITQSSIGVTDENESTTLGNRINDQMAKMFANILDAELFLK